MTLESIELGGRTYRIIEQGTVDGHHGRGNPSKAVRDDGKIAVIKEAHWQLSAITRLNTAIEIINNLPPEDYQIPAFWCDEVEPNDLYAVQYLNGTPLSDEIKKIHQDTRRRSLPARIQLGRNVAHAGITVIHGWPEGLLHTDIKPGNLILTPGESLTLVAIDWEFATTPEATINETNRPYRYTTPGTPLYMAPEQTRSRTELSRRSDDFSLGMSVFEALAGFNRSTYKEGANTLKRDRAEGRYRFTVERRLQAIEADLRKREGAEDILQVFEKLRRWLLRTLMYYPEHRPETAQEHIQLLTGTGNLDEI